MLNYQVHVKAPVTDRMRRRGTTGHEATVQCFAFTAPDDQAAIGHFHGKLPGVPDHATTMWMYRAGETVAYLDLKSTLVMTKPGVK